MSVDPAPLIVSALFGAADFAWLNGLRRAYFPPERNQLAAHLTLFHHLGPSLEDEIRHRLALAACQPAPAARAIGLLNLGRGVAIRMESERLDAIRAEIADAFHGMLTPQDAQRWRAHVTIQNKVEPARARHLLEELNAGFALRPVSIVALGLWRYRGGPWEAAGRFPFRGQSI